MTASPPDVHRHETREEKGPTAREERAPARPRCEWRSRSDHRRHSAGTYAHLDCKQTMATAAHTMWSYDRGESELLRAVFHSDTVCVAAFNAIGSRLLAGGILFTSEQFDAVSSADFQHLINTSWAKFATDLLSELHIGSVQTTPLS